MERYEDFEQVTRKALDYDLDRFPDVGPGLERLKEDGYARQR